MVVVRVPRGYHRSCAAGLTYPQVGATRDSELPSGYHHLQRKIRLGHGPGVFAEARRGLLAWKVQRHAGATVYPPGTPPEEGLTVFVGLGFGPARITARCRVVWTVDEPGRVGFGYGTLPGHPERGEESFVVTQDGDGEVWFEVRAFSQQATWYSRLGAPVSAVAQRLVTERYLKALLP